jgi:MarR family 2-MHQ and catechol resistance regulon transcriptional repressor
LTKEGRDVISKVAPKNEMMIEESMKVLDSEEKEKLLYLLKKMGGKLDGKKSENENKRF